MSLSRLVVWAVNAALAVLCCWIVAGIGSDVVGSWMGAPASPRADAVTTPPELDRSWNARQVILDRNLFKSATQPVEVGPDPEELEATKLPVKLLGTAAGASARSSWAAVEDEEKHQHLIVRIGDRLLGKADVVRIERRRIVLRNAGKMEELALDQDDSVATSTTNARGRTYTKPTRTAMARQPAGVTPPEPGQGNSPVERVQRLADDRFAVNREDVQSVASNPAALFSQARILPKYQDGQMIGIQLNSIQSGSLFEQIGIQNGDTITQLNGIQITNQQDSAAVLRQLTESKEFNIGLTGADGQQRTLTYEVSPH